MLTLPSMEHAVVIQARSYALLRWIQSTLKDDLVVPDRVDRSISTSEAAMRWIRSNAQRFPSDCQPPRGDVEGFARFFATYLESSFDFTPNPAEVLSSDGNHCFCPICTYLAQRPHFTTKKVDSAAKRAADHAIQDFVRDLSDDCGISVNDETVHALCTAPALRRDLALCAYGADLLKRIDGVADGPSTLALWRRFAWSEQGSPLKGFQLSAEQILAAQERVRAQLPS